MSYSTNPPSYATQQAANPPSGGGGGPSGLPSTSGISQSISGITSKAKPYQNYMLIGGIILVVISFIFKRKVPGEIMYLGVALAIFGAYLKFGARFNLPGA